MIRRLLETKYIKASSLYVFISVLPSALNFLLLPLYLRYISVEEYGYLTLLNLYAMAFNVFASLQVNIAASTQYFYKDTDKLAYRSGILLVTILAASLTFIAFVLSAEKAFMLFKNDIDFYPLGAIVLTSMALSQVQAIIFLFFKNEYRVREIGIFSVTSTAISVLSQVLLITYFDMGIAGIVYGRLISKVVIVTLLLIVFSKWFFGKRLVLLFSRKSLRYAWVALKFSVPFLPAALLQRAQTYSDRFVLEQHLSLDTIGQYAVLITLLTIPNLIVSAILSAFKPRIMELLESRSFDSIRLLEYFYLATAAIIFLFTLVLGSNLNLITNNTKYLEIRNYIYLGIFCAIPGSLLYYSHIKLMHAKKTSLISRYSFISFLVHITLLVILIPQYGIPGALIAMGCASLLNCLLCQYGYKKTMKLPTHIKQYEPVWSLLVVLFLGLIAMYYFGNIHLNSIVVLCGGIAIIVTIAYRKFPALADLLINESKPLN